MKVVFMGSPDFAVPALEALLAHHEVALVVTQPDKPAGRGGKLTPPAVKVVAERAGVEVYQPASARKPEVAERLRATGAELGVVVAYGKILPRGVLEAFPRGCVNVHGSLLPRWRGAAPIQRAVMAGDGETGVCIMQLDEGMDTGPVLLERRVAIGETETAGELFARLAPLGAEALLEAIARIDTIVPVPQPAEGATHAAMLTKADGAIEFARPATEVAARIRGVDPWPGAYARLRGEAVKLFGARIGHGHGDTQRRVGCVIQIGEEGMEVVCGEGSVVIWDIQLPGRKRVRAIEAARGRAIAVGDVLEQVDADHGA
jgi:methionyl-tRNA formyltransferase